MQCVFLLFSFVFFTVFPFFAFKMAHVFVFFSVLSFVFGLCFSQCFGLVVLLVLAAFSKSFPSAVFLLFLGCAFPGRLLRTESASTL